MDPYSFKPTHAEKCAKGSDANQSMRSDYSKMPFDSPEPPSRPSMLAKGCCGLLFVACVVAFVRPGAAEAGGGGGKHARIEEAGGGKHAGIKAHLDRSEGGRDVCGPRRLACSYSCARYLDACVLASWVFCPFGTFGCGLSFRPSCVLQH